MSVRLFIHIVQICQELINLNLSNPSSDLSQISLRYLLALSILCQTVGA